MASDIYSSFIHSTQNRTLAYSPDTRQELTRCMTFQPGNTGQKKRNLTKARKKKGEGGKNKGEEGGKGWSDRARKDSGIPNNIQIHLVAQMFKGVPVL